MTTAAAFGSALTTVAGISLVIYAVSLRRLLLSPPRAGLVRTVVTRIVGAVLYVGVGVSSIIAPTSGPVIGLGVFAFVQVLYWANQAADIRLARRQPRHRLDASSARRASPRCCLADDGARAGNH